MLTTLHTTCYNSSPFWMLTALAGTPTAGTVPSNCTLEPGFRIKKLGTKHLSALSLLTFRYFYQRSNIIPVVVKQKLTINQIPLSRLWQYKSMCIWKSCQASHCFVSLQFHGHVCTCKSQHWGEFPNQSDMYRAVKMTWQPHTCLTMCMILVTLRSCYMILLAAVFWWGWLQIKGQVRLACTWKQLTTSTLNIIWVWILECPLLQPGYFCSPAKRGWNLCNKPAYVSPHTP